MSPTIPSIKGRDFWSDALRRFLKDRFAVACLILIGVYMLTAALAAMGFIASPWDTTVGGNYAPPTGSKLELLFGTDIFGRSVLYKAIHGIRLALKVGLSACLLSVVIGVTLGSVAGYFGKWVDDFVVWLYSTLSSIPYILLLIAIAFVLERGITAVIIAIGATSWVSLCRIVRAEFMKHKEREYVLAAQSIGASHASRIFRHILPNVFHQVIISFSLQLQSAIKSEVILSYLGLGAQGQPSWGVMIDDAKLELARGVWWQLTAATIFMFLLILAFNIVGDALRDSLDPKMR